MNFTIIEYTPSSSTYDYCDRAYSNYDPSELIIRYYDDYEDALVGANNADPNNETTILIDGVSIEDILDYSKDEELRTMATGLKSLL